MNNSEVTTLNGLCIHKVGNKSNEDSIIFSKRPLSPTKDVRKLLLSYFFSSFKSNEYYTFFHKTDLSYNEAYSYVSKIFDNEETIYENSVNLAEHLYEQSTHSKIKAGEFYVVYFKDCDIEGEIVDAVGLFKSENKDTFLKVYPSGDGFEIESQEGVNINKLDKGCLIFNTERKKGYIVAVVDNTNKGAEAKYWTEDFLNVRPRQDEYYNTQNVLTLCKNFVTKELPNEFDVSKADQAEFLNNSVKFFKEKESFDMEEFANEVMAQPEIIEKFNKYKDDYLQEREIDIADNFTISDSAVKKQARAFKRVINLDKNIQIVIKGSRNQVEQGIDERGRKFYKIFYIEED